MTATVLAKTQDAPSIPILVRRLANGEWNQLEPPLLEALGAWTNPQLTQALARRAERAEPNQAWVARALAPHGFFDAWDRLPPPSLEAVRSFPSDRLDLESVSRLRSGHPAPVLEDRPFLDAVPVRAPRAQATTMRRRLRLISWPLRRPRQVAIMS